MYREAFVGAGHPARVACGHAELSLRVVVLQQSFLLGLLLSRLVCPLVLSSNTSRRPRVHGRH